MPSIPVNPVTHSHAGQVKPKGAKIVKKSNDVLGKDAFLKLLVKQLSTQNPLDPMDDKAFIAQMAQFSALEQMTNMSGTMNKMASTMKSLKSFQANSLIGKTVRGKDLVSGKIIQGTVSGIIFDKDGEAILRVNGKSIRSSDVLAVFAAQNVSRETLNPKAQIRR